MVYATTRDTANVEVYTASTMVPSYCSFAWPVFDGSSLPDGGRAVYNPGSNPTEGVNHLSPIAKGVDHLSPSRDLSHPSACPECTVLMRLGAHCLSELAELAEF